MESILNTAGETGELEDFIFNRCRVSSNKFASFSFSLDAIDPLACLEMCWKPNRYHYYWEKPSEDFAIAAGEELLHISAAGTNRFRKISRRIRAIKSGSVEYSGISHSYSGLMFLGGFSFFREPSTGVWDSFEPACFTVPKWMIIKDGKFSLLTLTVDLESFDKDDALYRYIRSRFEEITNLISARPSTDKGTPHEQGEFKNSEILKSGGSEYDQWVSSVNRAKQLIRQNRFNKIVLARQVPVKNTSGVPPTQIINVLRRTYNNCYSFLIHHPDGATFLGCTPERLASFQNNFLLSEALAGSMQRGKTATEDSILENILSTSTKNREEHNLVIKDIENRLHPYSREIERNKHPEVKKFSNVQHLHTPIRAQLKKETDLLSIVEQLHPTPAVGGYPRKNAALYIKELENFDRGWYAGPVGWLNSQRRGEFAVGIRSALLHGKIAYLFAGCGIVADSDPATEWEETNLKLKPMLSAFQHD